MYFNFERKRNKIIRKGGKGGDKSTVVKPRPPRWLSTTPMGKSARPITAKLLVAFTGM